MKSINEKFHLYLLEDQTCYGLVGSPKSNFCTSGVKIHLNLKYRYNPHIYVTISNKKFPKSALIRFATTILYPNRIHIGAEEKGQIYSALSIPVHSSIIQRLKLKAHQEVRMKYYKYYYIADPREDPI